MRNLIVAVAVSLAAASFPISASAQSSLSRTTMSGLDYSQKDLPGISADYSELSNFSFKGSFLPTANFQHAELLNIDFRGADLTGADFSHVDFKNVSFMGANLTGAKFIHADLDGVDMTGAKIDGVDWNYADMISVIGMGQPWVETVQFVQEPQQKVVTEVAAALKKGKVDARVLFEFDSDKLTPEGQVQVQRLAESITASLGRGGEIVVEGHTDAQGSDSYNQELSQRRAATVGQILSQQYGISVAGIVGKGEVEPVANNETDYGRAMNRRVTIVVK